MISLVGMLVIHKGQSYKGLAMLHFDIPGKSRKEGELIYEKLERLAVMVINTDGQAVLIDDEGWTFQFLPDIRKAG